jgi:hypothetical protein
MKIYIKNMVCIGTKSLIIKELENLGFSYNSIDPGVIDFKKDLSLNEIRQLNQALGEYGLEVTFRDIRFVTEIRCLIHDLVDNNIQLWNDFSNYITRKLGNDYAFLNKCFMLETGSTIETYYNELYDLSLQKITS